MTRFLILLLLVAGPVFSEEKKPAEKKAKNAKLVAGKADVLRHVKKKFAAFIAYDAEAHAVRMHIEGEDTASTWEMLPDAECRIQGWWGRPWQLQEGCRVWVWFAVDRQKKPVSILMIADEPSEQDIHGDPWVVESITKNSARFHQPEARRSTPRTLSFRNLGLVKGRSYYMQTGRDLVQSVASPEAFEEARAAQQDWLRRQWREEGLPGMVSMLHPLSGEMEVMLDHEAMRWARHLRKGAVVTLKTGADIKATVRVVEPWRERTRLRLVTNSGLDQVALRHAQRIAVIAPEPPEEVQAAHLPTDIGRLKDRQDRIDWFLASTYCSCAIAGDRCTGMYYSLASCNPNACGMPKEMTRRIGEYIDEGKSDREIFAILEKERHRDLWMPHLLR